MKIFSSGFEIYFRVWIKAEIQMRIDSSTIWTVECGHYLQIKVYWNLTINFCNISWRFPKIVRDIDVRSFVNEPFDNFFMTL